MMTIEKAPHGSLVFLKCGCAAQKMLEHPTGAAFLVQITEACATHASEIERVRAILRGELVSPFTRELEKAS
jgi:hypothetical protein